MTGLYSMMSWQIILTTVLALFAGPSQVREVAIPFLSDRPLRQISADHKQWPAEAAAEQIEQSLGRFAKILQAYPSGRRESLSFLLAPEFKGTPLQPAELVSTDLGSGLRFQTGELPQEGIINLEGFEAELTKLLESYRLIESVDFKLTRMHLDKEAAKGETTLLLEIHGTNKENGVQQDQALWKTDWKKANENWKVAGLTCSKYTRQLTSRPLFRDITETALGKNASYWQQLAKGADYWTKNLDAASGMDFYRLDGLAVGDYDNDGWEDFYVCQPGGLPDRLFRNRGDGTFEDVTIQAGLAVLDATASALWSDYDNDGDQDLFVIGPGVLLFENDGEGHFSRSTKAQFEIPSGERGSLMSAALADYDRDGFVDLYVCQYSPAGGGIMAGYLHQPTPYHEANNGPPNQLFRNRGDGTFVNVTRQSGLSANNRRWSLAAAWGDYNQDGFQDLYVANDFGRNNLYRNNGNGTFTDVAAQAGVEDVAAGMSVAWEDYDNDGRIDLYISNIWSAAGQRITSSPEYLKGAPEEIKVLHRRFAKGNTLYRNKGDGTFEDVTLKAGVENGGWAWGSDFFDFNKDGWEDLYIANGYITNDAEADLEGYHWREIAAQSPLAAVRSRNYDEAWRTFQDLMRGAGLSTHRAEMNRFYLNTGKGSFVDISGLSGLGLGDDARSFAVFDFDRDGDLDLIVKNRTAPQVRIFRNEADQSRRVAVFELTGSKSNRDAIGAKITLKIGSGTKVKEIEAGSGFLSQHSRRIYFGLSEAAAIESVMIQWPSGVNQAFVDFIDLPRTDRLVRIHESDGVEILRLQSEPRASASGSSASDWKPLPDGRGSEYRGTWLLERVRFPDVKVTDPSGTEKSLLNGNRGRPTIVNFRTKDCEPCAQELNEWEAVLKDSPAAAILSVSLENEAAIPGLKFYRTKPETIKLLNIVLKHLFVRRHDLGFPFTLLIDDEGYIVKIYRGAIQADWIRSDLRDLPRYKSQRVALALPFAGTYYEPNFDLQEEFFGIGFDCLNAGFLDAALQYFQECLRLNPGFGKALNNVGTIRLRKGQLDAALSAFRKSAELEPDVAEIQFNIGTALALKGRLPEAVEALRKAAELDSTDAEIWNNLGNAYLNLGRPGEARPCLEKALQLNPSLAEAHNNVGIIYGEQGQLDTAFKHFQEAARLQPNLDHAFLNMGLIYLHNGDSKRALEMFRKVVEINPAQTEAKQFINQLQQQR